jgi:hypothetical protein
LKGYGAGVDTSLYTEPIILAPRMNNYGKEMLPYHDFSSLSVLRIPTASSSRWRQSQWLSLEEYRDTRISGA